MTLDFRDDVGEVPDATSEIITYLRMQQKINALEKVIAEQAAENVALRVKDAERDAENAALRAKRDAEVAALSARIAQFKIALPTPPHNNFMSTVDFKRHFVEFVPLNTLVTTKTVCREWGVLATARINRDMKSGTLMLHRGNDILPTAS
ncbi:hypothetical protein TL16_g05199 [Triparma laevis f. inornata]|uniref:Uncharacterized protein n=1 Tax=Triparma laevis f. inornata TaxID=1714386 RepID=A0A9W7AGP2_9STRA|nr:hypothetical protein TL16_g05199 [Triparma laevis f. inornata]